MTKAELERDEARATIAAMREAVLEFQVRPPVGEFVVVKDGRTYAIPPDRISGYMEALDRRWKSADVRRWSEEFRRARSDKEIAEHDLEIAMIRISELERDLAAARESTK